MESKFKHYDLKLIEPKFESEVTDLIIDLDYLRKKKLGGTTHPRVFFQLKQIFHTLESIGSSRIEGNNTSIAEYIEIKLEEKKENIKENIIEIKNIEKAMDFIEENISYGNINRAFISELHKKVVEKLTPPPNGEGDLTPGVYRKINPNISNSEHKPPDSSTVESYMEDLIGFINKEDTPKYDLLKVAIAHHRFVWIHPFGNGNGRTVRLFTYAMLIKAGFNVDAGRIINPTAVFCSNRKKYYKYLASADTGSEEGILEWCKYVLSGLKEEIEKIECLLDYKYLEQKILIPTVEYALERENINKIEYNILKIAIEKQVIQADDLKHIFEGKASSEISRQIKKLIEKKMLIPEEEGKRKYLIRFDNNFLLRGIIKKLGENGFLPLKEDE